MCAVENIPGGGATVDTWFHAKDICIQGSGKDFHRRETKDVGGGGRDLPEVGRAWRQAESGCLSLPSEASLITSGDGGGQGRSHRALRCVSGSSLILSILGNHWCG